MWVARWLLVVILISSADLQRNVGSYMETLPEVQDTAVHRVQQDSSPGIQRIRIASDTRPVTVLPLSIDSQYTSSDNGGSQWGQQARDTLSKRQTNPSKSTKTQPKPAEKKQEVDARKNAQPQKAEVKTPKPEAVRPAGVFEAQSGQYGIGNTLVLLVPGSDNVQPSYVDQSQPHKVAPLGYDPSVAEKARVESKPKPERRPTGQKFTQPVPVRQDFYTSNEKESTEYTQEAAKHNGAKRTPQTESIYENSRVSTPTKVPPPYEPAKSSLKRTQEPTYASQENIRGTYDPAPIKRAPEESRQPMYEASRPAVQRPSYEEASKVVPDERYDPNYETPSRPRPARPSFEDSPTYVELRPAYEQPAVNNQGVDYAGFPESFTPGRGPAQSRPLQYEATRVFPPSPCSSVFQYEGREPADDFWNGEIYLTTDETLIGVRLDIELDRPARILVNWLAEAITRDNIKYEVRAFHKRLLAGPPEVVRITVKFNPDGSVPYLKSIILNGRRICPMRIPTTSAPQVPTRKPVFENPGDFVTKPAPIPVVESTTRTFQNERRPATVTKRPSQTPNPNPNYFEGTNQNSNGVPSTGKPVRPTVPAINRDDSVPCGKPAIQPRPLVTHGQYTSRGQWPWHAAIYKNGGLNLSYICGGSLISAKHVVTAAHCVTSEFKPIDASAIVVYLGKYHLKLWSEGGVQNKQVSEVVVHEQYNKTLYKADLAVLVLSSPVEFTEFIRPVCLWEPGRRDISEVANKVGTVIGWGFDESKELTEELMQAHMPVVKNEECLWSYPEFFPKFTSNLTYCAGFRNGTSVCNGDSGGGMVFPIKKTKDDERWYLRGLVSISVAEKDTRVCDKSHFVVFTDLAQFLPWLERFL